MSEESTCFGCPNYTREKCRVCSTPFCSEKCRQKNNANHAIFCYPELDQRLRSIIGHVFEKVGHRWESGFWNLSIGFYQSDDGLSNLVGDLNAFGMRKTIDHRHCVICGVSAWGFDNLHVVFYRKLYRVNYYLCCECQRKDRKLCPIWLHCTSKCTNVRTWWTFLMCLRRREAVLLPSVPKDIKKILFDLVQPCSH